ncbi:MAG: competence/damage-inducible protein A [Planctomycetaceae bacterium]
MGIAVMGTTARAEIIAVGTELTCGSKLDTNSQWLSRELESLGWTVMRHTTLPDELDLIVAELQAAAERSQAVLITGGLGPTLDDLTREALAAAFNQPLVRDPESLQRIEAMFAVRGRTMPARNVVQADRPEQAIAIRNDWGTAPGILLKLDASSGKHNCLLAAMPGVPAEMRPMFEQLVRPHLLDSGIQMCRQVIRTFGYGESEAERLLDGLTARGRNPEVGITASEAVISLWITARDASAETARRMCEDTVQQIRERLGAAVFGDGDAELHDVTAALLQSHGQSVSLLEGTTTGGQLAVWFTESPAAPAVLHESLVLPDWDTSDLAGWPQLIRDLMSGYFQAHACKWVLLSSPTEDQQAAGGVTVRRGLVALASADTLETIDVSMSGNLAIFRQRAARTALNLLRRRLLVNAD